MTRIGFIGLGNMGGPMAANLAKAGHTVQVFDLVAENIDRAIAAGCIAAGDAREALTGCEVVISMLPAGEHVRALWLGESAGERGGQDLLAALPVGALVIDCSTIDVDSARQVGEAARARGGNAIVAMRFDTTELGDVWTEICAYGTAVQAVPVTDAAKYTAQQLGYGG